MSDYRADNDWLRNEMATNMIYKKEADELRAEIERLLAIEAAAREVAHGPTMGFPDAMLRLRAALKDTKP